MGPILAGAALLVALLGAAIVLPWDSIIITEPIVRDTSHTEACAPQDTPAFSRRTVHFPSRGTRLEGWLYQPKGLDRRPPIVVAAHGIAGQKDMGLQPFAEAFAARGLAVLLFDYRCFGGSDGEPRNWVSMVRHLQDWASALDYVRSDLGGQVDVARMGLWGTSFAGGHVLAVAAKEGANVSAVVSQVPFLSGLESSKLSLAQRGVARSMRMFLAGLHDRARALAGLPPGYLPVAGLPGQGAFMELEQPELDLYYAKHPAKYMGGWQNRILARLVNELSWYNPIWDVPAIKAPVLMVAAARDSLCPIEVARRAAAANSLIRLSERDVGHFDVYVAPLFDEVASEQASFFVETLGARTPVPEAAEAMPLL